MLGFYRELNSLGYREADLITPCNQYNRRWEERGGADSDKIRTVYNGVDPHAFPHAGPEPEVPTLTWCGRVDPIKDLETLLRAYAMVRAELPETRLRLFGPVPAGGEAYQTRLEKLAAELGVTDGLTFEGRITEVWRAYAAGHIVMLSSISEGFPFSIIEAMSCGRTTVSTDVGGVSEAVGDTGLVVPPREPEKMAAAALTLLRDDERRLELGAVGPPASDRPLHAPPFRGRLPDDLPGTRGPARGVRTHPGDSRRLDPRTARPLVRGRRDGRSRLVSGSIWMPPGAGPGTLPAIPRQRTAPSWAEPDPIDQLAARLDDFIAAAVHPDEIAALLESDGMSDDQIRERYGVKNSFALAEELYDRVERRYPEPEGPAHDPWQTGLLGCLLRGVVFALPGLGYVLGAPLLAGPKNGLGLPAGTVPLLAGALVGWTWNQGLAHRAYSWLSLGDRPAARRSLLIGAPAGALLGSLVALAAIGTASPGAVAFAAAQSCYLAAATALLVLGRERSPARRPVPDGSRRRPGTDSAPCRTRREPPCCWAPSWRW